jgi:hypothetical protein
MNAPKFLSASIVALVVGGVVASDALADGKAAEKKAAPAAKAAAPVSTASLFDSLPKGKLDVPTHLTMPDSIPKGESVEGVYLEVPDYVKQNPATQRYAQVYASKEDEAAINQGNLPLSDACFMSASPMMSPNEEVRWNGSFANQTTIQPVPRSYSYGAYGSTPKDMAYVGALRVDRVTKDSPNKVTLESRIVLVDADSLGSRLVTTSKAEFGFIEELPGRVKVYGMKSDDTVTFLVERGRLPEERNSIGPMFAQQGNQGTVNTAEGCHLTFTLPIKQSSASTAVVQLETLLEIRAANADDVDANAPQAPMASDGPVLSQGMVAPGQKEGRIRPMQIGFSSTWLSEDKTPVVSISHGWTGRERTQPM